MANNQDIWADVERAEDQKPKKDGEPSPADIWAEAARLAEEPGTREELESAVEALQDIGALGRGLGRVSDLPRAALLGAITIATGLSTPGEVGQALTLQEDFPGAEELAQRAGVDIGTAGGVAADLAADVVAGGGIRSLMRRGPGVISRLARVAGLPAAGVQQMGRAAVTTGPFSDVARKLQKTGKLDDFVAEVSRLGPTTARRLPKRLQDMANEVMAERRQILRRAGQVETPGGPPPATREIMEPSLLPAPFSGARQGTGATKNQVIDALRAGGEEKIIDADLKIARIMKELRTPKTEAQLRSLAKRMRKQVDRQEDVVNKLAARAGVDTKLGRDELLSPSQLDKIRQEVRGFSKGGERLKAAPVVDRLRNLTETTLGAEGERFSQLGRRAGAFLDVEDQLMRLPEKAAQTRAFPTMQQTLYSGAAGAGIGTAIGGHGSGAQAIGGITLPMLRAGAQLGRKGLGSIPVRTGVARLATGATKTPLRREAINAMVRRMVAEGAGPTGEGVESLIEDPTGTIQQGGLSALDWIEEQFGARK